VVEANEPLLIACDICVNEGGTQATIVQVHPDADELPPTHAAPNRRSLPGPPSWWHRRQADFTRTEEARGSNPLTSATTRDSSGNLGHLGL
jgi:hypothetical protein